MDIINSSLSNTINKSNGLVRTINKLYIKHSHIMINIIVKALFVLVDCRFINEVHIFETHIQYMLNLRLIVETLIKKL